jgi:chromosome segregation ATPase
MSTCLSCNKICKNAAGLAIHMRTCKTTNARTLPIALVKHQCEIEADAVQIEPIDLSNLKDNPIQTDNINISDIDHEIKKYKDCIKKIEVQLTESDIILNSIYKKFSNEKKIIELELHHFKEKSERHTQEIKILNEQITENIKKNKKQESEINQLHNQRIEDIIANEQQDLELKRLSKYVTEKNTEIKALNERIAENIKKNKEQDLEINKLHDQEIKYTISINQQDLEIQKLSKYITEKNTEIKVLNERIENQSLKTNIRIEKIKHQEEFIENQNYEIKILKECNKQHSEKILEYKKLKMTTIPQNEGCCICLEKKRLVSVGCCTNGCCVSCFCKLTNGGKFKCPCCRRDIE